MLQCNVVSHWLGTCTKWSLWICCTMGTHSNHSGVNLLNNQWTKASDFSFEPANVPYFWPDWVSGWYLDNAPVAKFDRSFYFPQFHRIVKGSWMGGNALRRSWPCLNIKTVFPGYRDSHFKDEMAMRPSFLYYGNPYTGKRASLYLRHPLVSLQETLHEPWASAGGSQGISLSASNWNNAEAPIVNPFYNMW